ncbi:hypothetical protein O53_1959 [Microcystis aeruginosa TAIHU98]|uniref:Uncharacterized protein n=1 Tax=Microcystis aeruginosa TAIHU98 TaxID=1134457 RepID=L7ED06_MICAE|nr:hypothetical protein O53_1959 [Microcystis aeruginosa TAIHU98]
MIYVQDLGGKTQFSSQSCWRNNRKPLFSRWGLSLKIEHKILELCSKIILPGGCHLLGERLI